MAATMKSRLPAGRSVHRGSTFDTTGFDSSGLVIAESGGERKADLVEAAGEVGWRGDEIDAVDHASQLLAEHLRRPCVAGDVDLVVVSDRIDDRFDALGPQGCHRWFIHDCLSLDPPFGDGLGGVASTRSAS